MKPTILLVLLSILSFISFSQDIIYKRDSSTIKANIERVTSRTILYKPFNQQSAEPETIRISEVSRIEYENGDIEKFKLEEKVEDVIDLQETKHTKRTLTKSDDYLFKNGAYFDIVVGTGKGYTTRDSYKYTTLNPDGSIDYNKPETYIDSNEIKFNSFNMRVGNKWYFGKSNLYRPGLMAQWIKAGANIKIEDIYHSFNLTPLNIGLTNALKLSKRQGIELNIVGGLAIVDFDPAVFILQDDPIQNDWKWGYNYGVELKYRFGMLAIGVEYYKTNAGYNLTENRRTFINQFNGSIGMKF